jgi:hypothetical protein
MSQNTFNKRSATRLFVVKCEDPLKNEHVCPVHGDGLLLPAVCDKVVNGHLDLLSLFQPLEGLDKQVKVEGVGMIKVMHVATGGLVLLGTKDLNWNKWS